MRPGISVDGATGGFPSAPLRVSPHEIDEDAFGEEEEEGGDVENDVEEEIDVAGVGGDAGRPPPAHQWGDGEADGAARHDDSEQNTPEFIAHTSKHSRFWARRLILAVAARH